MNHPFQCACGTIKGVVSRAERASRGVCYCKDCQAFAQFLGKPDEILDSYGGTDVTATRPRYVTFTQGQEKLACMSLSPRGVLRWYASCCRTPIGNNGRNPKLAHVGLIHNCLEGPGLSLDGSFGPVRLRVNRQSAQGTPPSMPVRSFFAILGFVGSLAVARLTGGYRQNPFFSAGGKPIMAPQVLTLAQRQQLNVAVGQSNSRRTS